jgi:signal transduction histidine kinase
MSAVVKILVMDDNPAIHDIFEKLFQGPRDAGTASLILHAENGQAGLDILENNPDTDVVVLDLGMPIMNGFETLARIQADRRFRAIPVCVFSGDKDESTKALKLGARDFVCKPGDYLEIMIRVQNLIESKRRAEAGERVKMEFLSNVNHELRTPMNGVIGMMQLLGMSEPTPQQFKYIETLGQSATDMMSMIDSAINFLGSENPLHHFPAIPFSLRLTIQEAIDNLAKEAAKNSVTVSTEIDPALPDNLTGLPDKIRQIFHHLLSNAIKFSPAGKVCIGLGLASLDGSSIQIRCSVCDTGIGIAPEVQDNVFEPFFQADGSRTRKFGGLGLGLSIASRLVQMMGGTIHIESSPGGGSKFSFTVVSRVS